VDRLHVQGVAEHERDAFTTAQVGHPVPGKQTLDRHHYVRPKRRQSVEQQLLARRQLLVQDDVAGLVENAHRQNSGVQIDAAVESVLSRVEAHHGLLWDRRGPEPASWLEGYTPS
jgi:hypothetical protein